MERENLVLRHWAAVQPATRYLLGRGPTGCDTTKPLIAEENDPEVQLFPENHSPNSSSNGASQEQNWPRTPTGAPSRASFVMDQHHQHQHAPPPAPENIHAASYVDDLRKPSHASFDKPPFNPTVPSFPPNAHKFKPHPLYDLAPAPPAHFDQQSRLDADRMIVKRENAYAPPAPPGNNLGSLPPPASQYYTVDARGSFSRPMDSYPSRESGGHHTDMPPTPMSTSATTVPNPLYPQSTASWSEQYNANPTSTSTPQIGTSRPQPVTPILPHTAGNLSPASQATSNGNGSGMGVVPGYEQRRSVPYMIGGYGVPTSSTPTSYMSQSNQGLTYPAHLDNSQTHDNNTLSDSFRQ